MAITHKSVVYLNGLERFGYGRKYSFAYLVTINSKRE